MYYLTHRPKTISEIDNLQPKEILQKILGTKNLPHAFLFVGQKGTGKTSSARIFAKAVNCLNNAFAGKGNSHEPCNTCANCTMIDTSSFPDVTELDAASNRGINEVKNLIQESAFLPLSGRFRIFIIDEAHMITPDGFNALLKTLEEPPSTVIFILATTNNEKVPKTIASRCVFVPFGKAKKDEVIHMLKRIILKEKLIVADDVLSLIADRCDHSFRDAAKLLEELVIMQKMDISGANSYFGLKSQENLLNILQSLPLKNALQWIETFSQNGGSFKELIVRLLDELHILLLQKKEISETKIPTNFTIQEIVLLMKLFTEAHNQLRNSPIESIPLEIAVVEFYNKVRINELKN